MFINPNKNKTKQKAVCPKQLIQVQTSEFLLNTQQRQTLITSIQTHSLLSTAKFQTLGINLIHKVAGYCQLLPETAHSYYANQGGLFDHALHRTEAALTLIQAYLLEDASTHTYSDIQALWQYALMSASLLQGLGKLYCEFEITHYNQHGLDACIWNPLITSPENAGKFYFYQFTSEPSIEFRQRLNLLLANILIPIEGLQWLSSNRDVMKIWLALLNEDPENAGTLGTVLIRADAIAIQRYFHNLIALHHDSGGRSGRRNRLSTFSDDHPTTSQLPIDQI